MTILLFSCTCSRNGNLRSWNSKGCSGLLGPWIIQCLKMVSDIYNSRHYVHISSLTKGQQTFSSTSPIRRGCRHQPFPPQEAADFEHRLQIGLDIMVQGRRYLLLFPIQMNRTWWLRRTRIFRTSLTCWKRIVMLLVGSVSTRRSLKEHLSSLEIAKVPKEGFFASIVDFW